MCLSAKRESLARIHGRHQRAGRPHQMHVGHPLNEFSHLLLLQAWDEQRKNVHNVQLRYARSAIGKLPIGLNWLCLRNSSE